jgi:hypothetical protein
MVGETVRWVSIIITQGYRVVPPLVPPRQLEYVVGVEEVGVLVHRETKSHSPHHLEGMVW